MAKTTIRHQRSALGLMASGVAKITIVQTTSRHHLMTTRQALRGDQIAIRKDARSAYRKLDRVLESA